MTDLKLRAERPAGRQERTYRAQYQTRALPGGTSVEVTGYASTYGQPYTMYDAFGPYDEVARAGMAAKTLAEGADVAYLTNHGGLTLARTKAGTLTLSEDSTGLLAVATFNTTRTDVRDLVTAIDDGAIDQMSFAFRIVRQEWSPDYMQRDLVEIDLDRGDVSAVNFGANPFTSVGVQRAFRTQRAADLHRMALEVLEARAGKALSAATTDVLSRVLDLVAQADDAVDEAQPLLADLLGVPNPDAEAKAAADADAEQAVGYLSTLRAGLDLEAATAA